MSFLSLHANDHIYWAEMRPTTYTTAPHAPPAAAGAGGATPVVSPGCSGPGMARAPSAARSSACYPGRTSTRSHATPPSPPCAARCPANSARHGDRWLVGALIGSLHPFLFPSLSLLSRAFPLLRSLSFVSGLRSGSCMVSCLCSFN